MLDINSIAALAWSFDDSSLYADADDDGNHALFLINVANQTVSKCSGPFQSNCSLQAVRVLTNGNWHGQVVVSSSLGSDLVILTMDSWIAPSDLFSVSISNNGARVQGPDQLTYLNYNLASKYSLPEGESFYFQGWNGSQVQGWIWRPNGNAQ